jgi:hypothetical protein
VFIPTDVVRQAATAVAQRNGLAEDWLNDAVKGFPPGPDAQRFYSSDSLIADVASPGYLLAMKLFAARAEIDAGDIILLYRQLGFTTVDEGLDLVEQASTAAFRYSSSVRGEPTSARPQRPTGRCHPKGSSVRGRLPMMARRPVSTRLIRARLKPSRKVILFARAYGRRQMSAFPQRRLGKFCMGRLGRDPGWPSWNRSGRSALFTEP